MPSSKSKSIVLFLKNVFTKGEFFCPGEVFKGLLANIKVLLCEFDVAQIHADCGTRRPICLLYLFNTGGGGGGGGGYWGKNVCVRA